MDVSKSIRNLRQQHDMTQEQFGEVAGVSAMAVSQWENGRAVPRMGAIQKLADYFNVPKSTIMGDAVPQPSSPAPRPAAPPAPELTPDEAELVRCFRSMSDDRRARLLESARDYAALSVGTAVEAGTAVGSAVRK